MPGLALTAGGLATLLVMPLAGFLSSRVDARILIGFALTVQGIALWNMSTLNTAISFHDAAVARMIQSFALPFVFVTITNIAYVGISQKDNNQASALMNVARNLGGTFGISLVQTMLARQSQVHQAQYVESLNPLNPNYVNATGRITHQLMAHGMSQAQATPAPPAPSSIAALLQQAAMLSYIDVFHVLMWVVFLSVPLVLLLRKAAKAMAAAGRRHEARASSYCVPAGGLHRRPGLQNRRRCRWRQTYSAPSQAAAPLSMPVAESVDLSAWWKQFNDPELESLIARALAQNLDLLTAQSRVREARQQEIVAGAAGLPQVNAMANTVQLHSGSNPLGRLAGGRVWRCGRRWCGGGLARHRPASLFRRFRRHLGDRCVRRRAPLGGGGGSRHRSGALAGARRRSVADRRDRRRLMSSCAPTRRGWRSSRRSRRRRNRPLALITAKARAGFVTELDVNQQQQLVSQTQAQRPPLEADILVQRHAIAVLMGQQPGTLDAELEHDRAAAARAAAPAGGPAVRPAAHAARHPHGRTQAGPSHRPDRRRHRRPLSQVQPSGRRQHRRDRHRWTVQFQQHRRSAGLGGVTFPIFHGGQIHANITDKEEEDKQAYYAWQKAVLGGIQDAEDALARYRNRTAAHGGAGQRRQDGARLHRAGVAAIQGGADPLHQCAADPGHPIPGRRRAGAKPRRADGRPGRGLQGAGRRLA